MFRLRQILLLLLLWCTIGVVQASQPVDDAKVSIESVVRVTHLSTSGMNLWVEVDNKRCSAIVIKSGEVDIAVDGRHLVTISLRDKVVVPGRGCSEVLLPLRFRARNSFVLSALLRRIVEGEDENITLSYIVRGGTRLLRNWFVGEDVSIGELMSSLDGSGDMVLDLQRLIE